MSHKFVLMKSGLLYLADAQLNYHAEMTNDADKSLVQAAGYVRERIEGGFQCYGSSIGYNMAFRFKDGQKIEQFLQDRNVELGNICRYRVETIQMEGAQDE